MLPAASTFQYTNVVQLLRDKALRARNGKGFRYQPRIESKTHVSANLLARQFTAQPPNRKSVTDITYIKVSREWVHVAV